MLALHLLQSTLVLVNTRMVDRVLAEPEWAAQLTEHDRRGLTPAGALLDHTKQRPATTLGCVEPLKRSSIRGSRNLRWPDEDGSLPRPMAQPPSHRQGSAP